MKKGNKIQKLREDKKKLKLKWFQIACLISMNRKELRFKKKWNRFI